jgi:3-dehydroquinate synthase
MRVISSTEGAEISNDAHARPLPAHLERRQGRNARDPRHPIDTMRRMAVDATTVPVTVEGRRYDILIHPGLLEEIGPLVAKLTKASKAAVITDSTVGPMYAPSLLDSLKSVGIDGVLATIPAGEDHKNLASLSGIYDTILGHRIERGTPILALGGGVVGDMAGFIAATILRGVPFIQIPTTLLAMVDASVGGKTGINHSTGKNLIGAFHQPIAVLIDPNTLKTLPPRELRGGLAECIKHDIIRDADGFAQMESQIGRAIDRDIAYLSGLVAHNVAIKAKVVEADPFEKGERAHLNFGHTFGHAIETVSRYEYSHGECVALGMVAALRLAADLGMLDDASRRRIVGVIEKAGLPVGGMQLDPRTVADAMIFDKKVRGGRIRFILPDRIGHVVIRDNVSDQAALAALKTLGE